MRVAGAWALVACAAVIARADAPDARARAALAEGERLFADQEYARASAPPSPPTSAVDGAPATTTSGRQSPSQSPMTAALATGAGCGTRTKVWSSSSPPRLTKARGPAPASATITSRSRSPSRSPTSSAVTARAVVANTPGAAVSAPVPLGSPTSATSAAPTWPTRPRSWRPTSTTTASPIG